MPHPGRASPLAPPWSAKPCHCLRGPWFVCEADEAAASMQRKRAVGGHMGAVRFSVVRDGRRISRTASQVFPACARSCDDSAAGERRHWHLRRLHCPIHADLPAARCAAGAADLQQTQRRPRSAFVYTRLTMGATVKRDPLRSSGACFPADPAATRRRPAQPNPPAQADPPPPAQAYRRHSGCSPATTVSGAARSARPGGRGSASTSAGAPTPAPPPAPAAAAASRSAR